jgi:nucleoid-associated protein YgaU
MGLEHATITNLSVSPPPPAVTVQFNPSDYGIDRGAYYAELQVPGLKTPILQYVRGEADTLSLELFLDGTDQRGALGSGVGAVAGAVGAAGGAGVGAAVGAAGSVAGAVAGAVSGAAGGALNTVEVALQQLRAFVQIDPDRHAPPVCRFQWGSTSFDGVVTSLKEKYSLFDEAGHILRARVTLALKSYKSVEVQLRELRRSSPDRTRVRVLREGERLDLIANEAYGDPRLWQVIATANNIDRPRFVPPGTSLVIPAQ